MLTKAKETQLYHTLEKIDCELYLETSKPVDIIIAAELLPYIGDIQNLIRLISITLNPEGLLIISIEKDTTAEQYKLSENARFNHNPAWICELAASNYLDVVESRETTLRLHQSNPVLGQLMVLKKLKR
jgi:predicted TPR repeat methyltransferase